MKTHAHVIPFAVLAILFASGAAAAGPSSSSPETFDDLTTALEDEETDARDVVAIHVQPGQNDVLATNAVVDESVTLCRGEAIPTSEKRPTIEITVHDSPLSESPCVADDAAAPTPILDASAHGTTVLEVTADDVTVKDLALRWSVQPEDVAAADKAAPLPAPRPEGPLTVAEETQHGLVGVLVDGDDVTLEDNDIQMKTGPCAVGISHCRSPVPAAGVFLTADTSGALIQGNTIAVSLNPEEGTLGGDTGIVAAGDDYTIQGNVVEHWASTGLLVAGDAGAAGGAIQGNTFRYNGQADLHLGKLDDGEAPAVVDNRFDSAASVAIHVDEVDGVTLEDNAIVRDNPASTGVLVEGGQDVRLQENQIGPRHAGSGQAGHAVTITTAGAGDVPENVVLRRNEFRLSDAGLNQYAIQVTPDAQGITVDARLNDWDVYTWGAVRARVSNLALDTLVLQSPFLT